MRLEHWLNRRAVTPKELAEKLGVDLSTIYRYLDGTRRPAWPVLQRLEAITKGAVQASDFFQKGKAA